LITESQNDILEATGNLGLQLQKGIFQKRRMEGKSTEGAFAAKQEIEVPNLMLSQAARFQYQNSYSITETLGYRA